MEFLLDSGADVSIMSGKLCPPESQREIDRGSTTLNGIGGKQKAGSPVTCDICFDSGWKGHHDLKPTELSKPNLVILGRDFMGKYGDTVFNWSNDRVKLGDEWVMTAEAETPNCSYGSNLSPDQAEQLKLLVDEFSDVFVQDPKAPKACSTVKHIIRTKEDRICFERARRLPEKWERDVEQQVEEMKKNDIICESSSPYNSNILLVDKKDGTKRFVIDYRNLNKTTEADTYPLPNVDRILEKCKGAKFFTQLDLASSYWNIPVVEEDQKKTAFSVPGGKYQCKRMPYGLKNAQATLQREMDDIVRELKRRNFKGAEAYVDNSLLFSRTFEEHIALLRGVFIIMRERNLSLRADKCEIGYNHMEFLGFRIDGITLKPCPHNIEKLLKFPRPTDKKGIQRMMGIANFNRRFIPHIAELTKPLTAVLSHKIPFTWGEEQETAFLALKEAMGKAENLALPDHSEPFHMRTDASGVAFGCQLYQLDSENRIQTIAYHSRTLSGTQRRWGVTERELGAIIDAKRKFRVYCNRKTVFHTDHEPLRNIRQQKDPRYKISRWLTELETIDCSIEYLPGKENVVADGLSRICVNTDTSYDDRAEEDIYPAVTIDKETRLKSWQREDKAIMRAIKELKKKGEVNKGFYRNYPNLKVKDDLLHKGDRIIIPPKHTETLITDFHGQYHPGSQITCSTLRGRFWWRGMSEQIRKFVENCRTCSQTKLHGQPVTDLQITEAPKPRAQVAVDMGYMPPSPRGNCCFILIVDIGTKMTVVVPMLDQKAETLKTAFKRGYVGYFGTPQVMISDQGRNIDQTVIRGMCDELGIEKRHSSTYHPEGNGNAERGVQTFKARVSAVCASRNLPVTDWDLITPEIMLAINGQVNKSLKYSPFMCSFGSEARLPIDNFYGLPTNELHTEPSIIQQDADHNRQEAKSSYKRQHDKKSKHYELEVGQRVLIKRDHGKFPKIAVNWRDGPYTLIRKTGPSNWLVRNSRGKKQVYHTNKIKPALDRREPQWTPPYQQQDDEPTRILPRAVVRGPPRPAPLPTIPEEPPQEPPEEPREEPEPLDDAPNITDDEEDGTPEEQGRALTNTLEAVTVVRAPMNNRNDTNTNGSRTSTNQLGEIINTAPRITQSGRISRPRYRVTESELD